MTSEAEENALLYAGVDVDDQPSTPFYVGDIELLILLNGIKNPLFASSFNRIQPEFFEKLSSQAIAKVSLDYYQQHSSSISLEMLHASTMSSDVGVDLSDADLIELKADLSYIESHHPESDVIPLIDLTEDWVKLRSVYNRFLDVSKVVESQKSDEVIPLGSIVPILEDALSVTVKEHSGSDYFESASDHFDRMRQPDVRISTGIKSLDDVMNGGPKKNTANVVLMGINVGKTTALINFACNTIELGRNALYVSLEIDEDEVRNRADARLMGVSTEVMEGWNKETYLTRVGTVRANCQGNLFIKRMPTRGTSSLDIINYARDLEREKGIKISTICLDHIVLLNANSLPMHTMGSNPKVYFQTVTEEFREASKMLSVVGWTASQFNRGGQDGAEGMGMKDIGASIGILETADFAIAFEQPEILANLDLVSGTVLKSRYKNNSKQRNKSIKLTLDNDLQLLTDASKDVVNSIGGSSNDESIQDRILGAGSKKVDSMSKNPLSDAMENANIGSVKDIKF